MGKTPSCDPISSLTHPFIYSLPAQILSQDLSFETCKFKQGIYILAELVDLTDSGRCIDSSIDLLVFGGINYTDVKCKVLICRMRLPVRYWYSAFSEFCPRLF